MITHSLTDTEALTSAFSGMKIARALDTVDGLWNCLKLQFGIRDHTQKSSSLPVCRALIDGFEYVADNRY